MQGGQRRIAPCAPTFQNGVRHNAFSGPKIIAVSVGGRLRWMIEPCGWRWSAIGMLRTRAISRSNMKSIARMLCLIIRNRASGSAVGTTFRRADSSSQTRSVFTVRRIIGSGDLWVTEFVLTYHDITSYAVSIMEFREGLVANETQYL